MDRARSTIRFCCTGTRGAGGRHGRTTVARQCAPRVPLRWSGHGRSGTGGRLACRCRSCGDRPVRSGRPVVADGGRRCRTLVPVGLGDQAGHGVGRAGGGRGGHARPRRTGGTSRIHGPSSAGPCVGTRAYPGPPVESPGLRRIYSNAGFQELALLLEAAFGDVIRRLPDRRRSRAAGHGRHGADRVPVRSGRGRTAGPLRRPPRPRSGVGPAPPGEPLDLEGGHIGPIPDGLPGVLPGFGPFDECDWGLGVESARSQASPLDRDQQLAVDVRPFRPDRLVPVGRSGRRGAVCRTGRPSVRGVVITGLAGPGRCRTGRARGPEGGIAAVRHRPGPSISHRPRTATSDRPRPRLTPLGFAGMKGVLLAGGTGSRLIRSPASPTSTCCRSTTVP